MLERARPDVVGLQEVWATADESQARVLADLLGMHVAWGPSPAPERFQRRIGNRTVLVGNAILSRWPITREAASVLPAGADDAGRTVLFALVDAPCGAVPFSTTQLTSAVGDSALPTRQVRTLARFVVEETPDEANPLVTG